MYANIADLGTFANFAYEKIMKIGEKTQKN